MMFFHETSSTGAAHLPSISAYVHVSDLCTAKSRLSGSDLPGKPSLPSVCCKPSAGFGRQIFVMFYKLTGVSCP